jgi:hypothetical protein
MVSFQGEGEGEGMLIEFIHRAYELSVDVPPNVNFDNNTSGAFDRLFFLLGFNSKGDR